MVETGTPWEDKEWLVCLSVLPLSSLLSSCEAPDEHKGVGGLYGRREGECRHHRRNKRDKRVSAPATKSIIKALHAPLMKRTGNNKEIKSKCRHANEKKMSRD